MENSSANSENAGSVGDRSLRKNYALFPLLKKTEQEFIEALSRSCRFTFQELRRMIETARDFEMWGEVSLEERWRGFEKAVSEKLATKERKERLLKELFRFVDELKRRPKSYRSAPAGVPGRKRLKAEREDSEQTMFGDCPVASPKTVCCNLKTIDAVQNCAFGCSYCAIQTFYPVRDARIVFDAGLREKLRRIPIDPNRFYHIGTGQSSDSLAWGNQNGILDDLCEFAREHPNVLLEFKTKSANVSYFLDRKPPPNIVLSWSLNTNVVVKNEEHFTASLEERIQAARRAARRGTQVAFHFHPLVYYEDWDPEYPDLAARIQNLFRPEQVLFISFGAVTLIKPVIREIRKRGGFTKILQMEFAPAPHGKLTYPDSVKLKLFRAMSEAFRPWHGKVFMYLCMEAARVWDGVFGRHYATNEEFEADFARNAIGKVTGCLRDT